MVSYLEEKCCLTKFFTSTWRQRNGVLCEYIHTHIGLHKDKSN